MPGPASKVPTTHLAAAKRAEGRHLHRAAVAAGISLAAAACAAVRDGFSRPLAPVWSLVLVQALLLVALALTLSLLTGGAAVRSPRQILAAWLSLARRRTQAESDSAIPPTRFDAFILLFLPLLAAGLALAQLHPHALLTLDLAALLAVLLTMARLGVRLLRGIGAPQLVLPATFALLIFIGTALLSLPRCAGSEPVRLIDALFTSTSAVCVTGLTVRSTASGFSPSGQAVICLLIQLGGLGIVVFGATFAALLRGTLSLREHVTVRDLLDHSSVADLRRFALRVVIITLAIEALGAALMYPLWPAPGEGPLASSPAHRAWLSIFHAVSAFCNAGFDITGASMVPYRFSAIPLAIIAALVILGGIGFPVLFDLWKWLRGVVRRGLTRRPAPRPRLALHSRLTLIATGILLLGGAGLLALGQAGAGRDLYDPSIPGRAADAWFMSLTARTAGFNSVPMEQLSTASNVTLMALMAVGGSPGSTAGGFKTTTLAVLVLATIATLRARRETEVSGRSIPEALVRKAGALALCMFALVLISTLLLCLAEPRLDPFKLLFEALSAATTTGLSLGVTAELSDPGKLVLIATMFLGRVGPLTLLGVLMIRRPPPSAALYPRETVTLG